MHVGFLLIRVGAQRPIPVQGLFWSVCSHHLLSLLGGGSLAAPAEMPRHAGGQIDEVKMASGAPVMRCYMSDEGSEAYLDFASLQVRDYKSPNRMGEQENVRQK